MPAKKPAKKKVLKKKPARKPAAKAKAKARPKSKTVKVAKKLARRPAKKPAKKPAKRPAAATRPAAAKAGPVDALLKAAKYPFEAEVNAVRAIIKGAHAGVTEEWKWAAPCLSYKGYLATFNLWQKAYVQLIFHNGAILSPSLGIFEGNYPDRRMVNFANMAEVDAKRAALVKAVEQWVKLMDAKG